MEIADSDIVRRMQSKTVSKSEFEFDNMFSRPLNSYLSQWDIDHLYAIASSVRYAGNAAKKFKAIDKIMEPRGFTELSAGTNRICYRSREDDSIVIKVAYNNVGRKDNPAEFTNQNLLKPFCSKVYEVSSDGTVALDERVKPIKSREEFISVADDIFAICWMFTQKYILADFGSHYFMNWGTRLGFGPVILDYSYLYEVDGDKLICKAPNPNDPSGICGGLIDYDEGFNHLKCTKCGATYKAIEIAKAIKSKEIIRGTNKEENNMKVGFVWNGRTVINDTNEENVFKPATKNIEHKKFNNKKAVPVTEGIPKVRLSYNTNKEPNTINQKREVNKENKNKEVKVPKVRLENVSTSNSNETVVEDKPAEVKKYSKLDTNIKFEYDGHDADRLYFKPANGEGKVAIDIKSVPKKVYETITGVSEEELEFTKRDLDQIENKNIDLGNKIIDLSDKIADLEKKNKELEDENQKLKEDVSTDNYQMDMGNDTVEELKDTINTMTENHNKQAKELTDKNKLIEVLQHKLEEYEQKEDEEEVSSEPIEEDGAEYESNEEESEFDPDDPFYFVEGKVYKLSEIADTFNLKMPEGKSEYVLAFEDKDGNMIANDAGQIMCVDKLIGRNIDDIEFVAKDSSPEEDESEEE